MTTDAEPLTERMAFRKTRSREATLLRAECRALGQRNRMLREAIQFTAIPTLQVFAEGNDGVRHAVAELRRVVAESVR